MNRIHVMCSAVWSRVYNWRRLVGVVLIAVLVIGVIFPTPVYGQLGLLGSIQNIINIINGAIQSALNLLGAVSQSLQALYQQIVWPVQLIDQARNTITDLINQFRGTLQSIYTVAINSATLPVPVTLESIIRNRQTNDFPTLTQSYYRAFGVLPTVDEADSLSRNMIDIDDTLALNTLKTLKAADQASDVILQSGDRIEDEARVAAPGSAPFLTAAATAANVQSQALMQKMLAAMLRQEAARIAHDNSIRKRHGILTAKVRQGVSDILRRP
jgi:hypothetical protein